MEFGQVVQCVLLSLREAGRLMSKSLPPKINLREGKREEGGRNGRGGDGGGGREPAPQRGPKGKESPFQWNKNCAMSTRSARRLWKRPRVQGTRVHFFSLSPSFSSQTVSSDSGTVRAGIWRPDVQRDAREPVLSGSVMPCPSANTSHIFPGLRGRCRRTFAPEAAVIEWVLLLVLFWFFF